MIIVFYKLNPQWMKDEFLRNKRGRVVFKERDRKRVRDRERGETERENVGKHKEI